jgi:hypothetical protein
MAYDAARRETLVLNVSGNPPTTIQTWTWDGSAWKHLSPASSPDTVLSLTFDAARAQVVGFGKNAPPEASVPGETWTWDGESWHRESPAIEPPARQQPSLVYDSKRKRVVMYGGVSRPNERLRDVWAWDGTNWSRLADLPEAFFDLRDGAYDPVHDQIVQFLDTGYQGTSEVLLFNGFAWTEEIVSSQDLPTSGPLALDENRQQIVLFADQIDRTSHPPVSEGGRPSTWVWDGSNWTNISTGTGPLNRADALLAYDSTRRALILFGGTSELPPSPPSTCCGTVVAASDLWEFDGRTWARRA